MQRKLWLSLALVGLLLFLGIGSQPATAQNEKSYSADQFDVDVAVQPDGSIIVNERIDFRFVGGPFTFVFRELPTDLTDGIVNISAAVDGDAYPAGTGPGQVEITGQDPIRITWHLPPTSDAVHRFILSYQVLGVVRQETDADRLLWQLLPDRYDYQIGRSLSRITYPETTQLVSPPLLVAGSGDLVQRTNNVLLTSEGLAPNSPLIVDLRFTPGSLISAPPAWQAAEQARQAAQQERDRFAPLWLLLGGLLLASGLVAFAAYWQRARPGTSPFPSPVYDPPSNLAPALAGTLVSTTASPTWNQALGTLFDLSQRGVLIIEELSKEKWYASRDFVVKLVEVPAGLLPHEEGLLDLLYETKKGRVQSIRLSKLGGQVTSGQWKRFEEPLKAESKAAGYLSPARKATRQRLIGLGIAGFMLSIVGLVAIALLQSFLSLAAMAVPLALAVLGMVILIAGGAYPVKTDEALQLAGHWQAFFDHLKALTKGKTKPTRPDLFELYLPYAAAAGLLHAWAKRFEKAGVTAVPGWFHPLADGGSSHMAVFVAMTAATSSSGGSAAGAAGAAGAGAAGGGASGAG